MGFEFFNDNEIAQMRADVANVMPGTAYILRFTPGGGLYGGHGTAGTWGTVGTLACRLDRLSQKDNVGMIAEAEEGRTFYQATFPYDATVVHDGDDIKVNSVVYQVLQVSHGQTADIFTRAVVATSDEGS